MILCVVTVGGERRVEMVYLTPSVAGRCRSSPLWRCPGAALQIWGGVRFVRTIFLLAHAERK